MFIDFVTWFIEYCIYVYAFSFFVWYMIYDKIIEKHGKKSMIVTFLMVPVLLLIMVVMEFYAMFYYIKNKEFPENIDNLSDK